MLEKARAVIDARVGVLQLRLEQTTDRVALPLIRAVVALARPRREVIVNDRVDLALAGGADGVHLGADDLPVDVARRLLGPAALIGATTRSRAEIEQARRWGRSRGLGPIFATRTKVVAHAPWASTPSPPSRPPHRSRWWESRASPWRRSGRSLPRGRGARPWPASSSPRRTWFLALVRCRRHSSAPDDEAPRAPAAAVDRHHSRRQPRDARVALREVRREGGLRRRGAARRRAALHPPLHRRSCPHRAVPRPRLGRGHHRGAFDIPPEFYGAQARPGLGALKQSRTNFELAVLKMALQRKLPVLGICGGMQLLNVAYGGTLIQDIATELPQARPHEQKHDRTQRSTPSRSKTSPSCPSAWRQGAADGQLHSPPGSEGRGSGLTVAASAPDGVVEAIESMRKTNLHWGAVAPRADGRLGAANLGSTRRSSTALATDDTELPDR